MSKGLRAARLVAPPLVLLAGWIVQRGWGHTGPGPGWTVAHLLWTVAYLGFMVIATVLYRMRARRSFLGTAAYGLAIAGGIGMLVQTAIDLIVGFQSPDRAGMSAHYAPFYAVPGVRVLFFVLAPILLYVGMVTALYVLAAQRRVPLRAPVLVGLGIVLIVVGRGVDGVRLLEGLGQVCVVLALALAVSPRPVPSLVPASRTRTTA
jgi:hypothetical protein